MVITAFLVFASEFAFRDLQPSPENLQNHSSQNGAE
jgi:hypothetical protein